VVVIVYDVVKKEVPKVTELKKARCWGGILG
jgi:hypothetical protein